MRGVGKFCDFWHNSALYLAAMTYEEKAMTHIKFSTFENPRWRSLTDEHLTEQHWQPVFLFSKSSVSIHVCCSYISQNCTRRAIFRLGIDTLIANILVVQYYGRNNIVNILHTTNCNSSNGIVYLIIGKMSTEQWYTRKKTATEKRSTQIWKKRKKDPP